MTKNQKHEALSNALEYYKFPKKYFIQNADGRIGSRFAIASNVENGGIEIHSRYMTYDEFNAYLFGWYDGKMKKF
jgi:hypothetical protein